ncbi:hypothetical protein PoB_007269000 [Plakobranchus ocellatus]|uniref:Uncharacterized protein n=1 Tax=Plakobranchus ocellatus TaxID=259542 RepID=A0AAV4DQ50_9GAST|nr:hypothetical protein PoB_007269000 [Plakobranchus ocellatus]
MSKIHCDSFDANDSLSNMLFPLPNTVSIVQVNSFEVHELNTIGLSLFRSSLRKADDDCLGLKRKLIAFFRFILLLGDSLAEEAHTTRLLISKIRNRQATFFGHVMRREKLENLVTTGMLEGKQREKLIEGLTDWLKAGKSLEAIEATKDRKKWRTMIANAVKQGT